MTGPGRASALLIEDDEDYLTILRTLCDEEFLVSTCATDGNEALRLLEREDFAVIVLDLQIPGLDGISLIDHLRGARPDLLERVVLFTGFANVARAIAPDLQTVPKADVSSLRYAIRRVRGADESAN